MVVIEHNLESLPRTRSGVIKTADWIIDVGPKGGDKPVLSLPKEAARSSRPAFPRMW